MSKPFLCTIGIHKWGRATYIDYSFHSNIKDWKQICGRCGKRITWIQPKGLNEKFYPIYWVKRFGWWIIAILLIVGYLAYRYVF